MTWLGSMIAENIQGQSNLIQNPFLLSDVSYTGV